MKEDVFGSAGNTFDGEAKVVIEIFVFDGDGGVADVIRKRVEFDRSTITVSVDLVEDSAVSVHDSSRDRVGLAFKFGGGGEIFEGSKDDN